MKLTKLYKKTKAGKVAFIELYTRKVRNKDIYKLCTKTGTLSSDKTKVSHVTISSGKNIGRSNETSVKEQAEKELLASWNKLFDKGYKEDLKYVQSCTFNTFKDYSSMPQLLNNYKVRGEFKPGYAQFKKDGCRNLGEKFKDVIRNKSRESKIFDLPEILKSITLLKYKQLDEMFDGELYCHGMALQDITKAVKNGDPKNVLEYHIYDIAIEGLTFAQRRNLLLALDVSNIPNVVVDPGVPVNTQEELDQFHQQALQLGYEGTVFCAPDALYDFGFRSSGKSKIKPRSTREYKCVDHYMNRGKMSKQSTLVCITEEGKPFHVKLKGTNEQREEWAANFETDVKDKMITVEYRKLSNDKKPIEAVGIAIRDYE